MKRYTVYCRYSNKLLGWVDATSYEQAWSKAVNEFSTTIITLK